MNDSELQWRKIDGYEYEVSNRGDIRHLKYKKLRKHIIKGVTPYHQISVAADGTIRMLFVHIEVAKAFLPRRSLDSQVRHLDGDYSNNNVTNLAWGRDFKGKRNSKSRLTNDMAVNIWHCKGAISAYALSALYKISDQTVYDIWNHRRWAHLQLGGD